MVFATAVVPADEVPEEAEAEVEVVFVVAAFALALVLAEEAAVDPFDAALVWELLTVEEEPVRYLFASDVFMRAYLIYPLTVL